MIASNHIIEECTPSRRLTCSRWKLISSSRNLRIIPKIGLQCILFKPWKCMTCEVCGNVGHSGDNCPETQEEALYLNGNNNGFRPQGGQGWNQPRPYYQGGNGYPNSFNPNQPTLRDLVYGQAKINESLQKKLAATDKSMETICWCSLSTPFIPCLSLIMAWI